MGSLVLPAFLLHQFYHRTQFQRHDFSHECGAGYSASK